MKRFKSMLTLTLVFIFGMGTLSYVYAEDIETIVSITYGNPENYNHIEIYENAVSPEIISNLIHLRGTER